MKLVFKNVALLGASHYGYHEMPSMSCRSDHWFVQTEEWPRCWSKSRIVICHHDPGMNKGHKTQSTRVIYTPGKESRGKNRPTIDTKASK